MKNNTEFTFKDFMVHVYVHFKDGNSDYINTTVRNPFSPGFVSTKTIYNPIKDVKCDAARDVSLKLNDVHMTKRTIKGKQFNNDEDAREFIRDLVALRLLDKIVDKNKINWR